MHDVPTTEVILDDHNSRSSIYEKTTVDERRKIDRAVVNREPPTYRGVFEKYRLAEKGVSFTAFYNYARRIRGAATNYNLAELVIPAQADLNRTIPRLLADRLIDTLLYAEDATPAQIHRLTVAYASAINSSIKAHAHFPAFRQPVAAGASAGRGVRANDDPLNKHSEHPSPTTPAPSEPPPQGGADWPSNESNPAPSRHDLTRESRPSEISNSQISNPPPPALSEPPPQVEDPPRRGRVASLPNADNFPANREPHTAESSIPHSAIRVEFTRRGGTSAFPSSHNPVNLVEDRPGRINPVHSLPDPLAARINLADLPDPDPRREALRQRILANMSPVPKTPDSS